MIRPFKKDDLDSIMKIWLESNINAHDFIEKDYWKNNYEAVKRMMPNATIYVYENGDVIQGFIGLMNNYIAGIFVCNELQSKGIGKQVLDYTKDRYENLSLHVYEKNNRAVHFYQREKFTFSARQIDEKTGESEFVMVWKK